MSAQLSPPRVLHIGGAACATSQQQAWPPRLDVKLLLMASSSSCSLSLPSPWHTPNLCLTVSLMCFNGAAFFHLTLAQTVNQPDQRENTTVLSHSLAWHTPTSFSALHVSHTHVKSPNVLETQQGFLTFKPHSTVPVSHNWPVSVLYNWLNKAVLGINDY